VRYEIVPGVTAATACAAGARIPLTHRDAASGVVFVTGHAREGGPELDWSALARTRQTLVVYMGLHTLPRICAGLVTHGRAPATPVALVERGGTDRQRVITATLDTIVARAREARVEAPALVVVGEVVDLRHELLGGVGRRRTGVRPIAAAAA
jgi:siroheme synthase